jgi:hypothetical protein
MPRPERLSLFHRGSVAPARGWHRVTSRCRRVRSGGAGATFRPAALADRRAGGGCSGMAAAGPGVARVIQGSGASCAETLAAAVTGSCGRPLTVL